jgi:hypothetical protein
VISEAKQQHIADWIAAHGSKELPVMRCTLERGLKQYDMEDLGKMMDKLLANGDIIKVSLYDREAFYATAVKLQVQDDVPDPLDYAEADQDPDDHLLPAEKAIEEPAVENDKTGAPPVLNCGWCGKAMTTLGKRRQHEVVCGKNPNRPNPRAPKSREKVTAPEPMETKLKPCRHCGKPRDPRGLSKHESACAKKKAKAEQGAEQAVTMSGDLNLSGSTVTLSNNPQTVTWTPSGPVGIAVNDAKAGEEVQYVKTGPNVYEIEVKSQAPEPDEFERLVAFASKVRRMALDAGYECKARVDSGYKQPEAVIHVEPKGAL